jgi:hypothetical protein
MASVIALCRRLDKVKKKMCGIDCKITTKDREIINPMLVKGVEDLEKLVSVLETNMKKTYPDIGKPFVKDKGEDS